MKTRRAALVGLWGLALGTSVGLGQGLMVMGAGSTYQDECLGPCACPGRSYAVGGTFALTYSHSDLLFDYYHVTGANWTIPGHTFSGAGVYQVGGEVAYMQRLTMAAEIDGVLHNLDSMMQVVEGWPTAHLVITIEDVVHESVCNYVQIEVNARVTCTPDYDGDGDAGTDADIGAFFACLAGSCCLGCASSDFNGDGDTGTDLDIESFFRVLAGASC